MTKWFVILSAWRERIRNTLKRERIAAAVYISRLPARSVLLLCRGVHGHPHLRNDKVGAMTAKAYGHNKRAVKTALDLSIKPLFRVIHRAAFPYYVYLYLPRIFKLVFNTFGNIVSHKHHLIVRYRVRLNNYAHLAARLYCV